MTYFEAYLLTRLNPIIGLGIGTLMLGVFGIILCLVIYGMTVDSYRATSESISKAKVDFKKRIKYAISLLLCGSIIITFMPTTKEMAFIYIAPALVNNADLKETVSKLPSISKLGLEYIEETLKDNINNKIKENVSK